MEAVKPWVIFLCVLIGNCGFWLFCFNRINSCGLPRRWTKTIEKLFIAVCFALPALVLWAEHRKFGVWLLDTSAWWPSDAPWFDVWGVASLSAAMVLGPAWLESRRWMLPPKALQRCASRRLQLRERVAGGAAGDRLTRWLIRLPGNEITQLEVNRKELLLPRPLPLADGFRIGHISDLHLTGQFKLEHYQRVFDEFLALEPDWIAVTGDIIDYARCLDWLEPLLGRLRAPLGCTFLLGNHDVRIGDSEALSGQIARLGHFDIGIDDQRFELASGGRVIVMGNEQPWLERHPPGYLPHPPAAASANELRIGLSHAPDQIEWARRQQLDLLLAGHTHGGQVRFPLIGPIVAPSRYGTRFASGVFSLPPTLMHVSRGISGTHPLRWRCRPEVSLLELRSPRLPSALVAQADSEPAACEESDSPMAEAAFR